MSITEIILSRMMNDNDFEEMFFTDAEKALEGYILTDEELARFKNLTRAQFQAMTVENRKSFAAPPE